MRPRLNIIIASTRPGRVGAAVAEWVVGEARAHDGFDVALVDLLDMGLPLYDEPRHPRFQTYEHTHTRRWSRSVGEADAFVFVTPEYNYGPSPALLNALNYVYVEWNYKPAAFVSYGGVSGGIRAVQMAKLILTTLKMVPILEQVMIPMIGEKVRDGVFQPAEVHVQSAAVMLTELHRWAEALKPMRSPAP
jgi:NAD(P)H-dependent FMN reductase